MVSSRRVKNGPAQLHPSGFGSPLPWTTIPFQYGPPPPQGVKLEQEHAVRSIDFGRAFVTPDGLNARATIFILTAQHVNTSQASHSIGRTKVWSWTISSFWQFIATCAALRACGHDAIPQTAIGRFSYS